MRLEYAILGIIGLFAFVLLVSSVYPDSLTANAITQSPSKGISQTNTCCLDAKQSIRVLEGRIAQLEQRIATVSQQQRAGEQNAEAQPITEMFRQCRAFGAAGNTGNCNEACASIGKTCAFALEELVHLSNFVPEYTFSACTAPNYRDEQMYIRHNCMCC